MRGKPFQKGQPGGPGRPEGVKNKNYTNVSLWLELIWERIPQMSFEQQVENSWKAVNALLPKIAALPANPGDSVNNGRRAFEMMNGLAPSVEPNPPLETQPSPPSNGSNGA